MTSNKTQYSNQMMDVIQQKLDSLIGVYMLFTMLSQVCEKLLQNIFSDNLQSHISNIIEFGQFSISALQFFQGFQMHLYLNYRNYQNQDYIKMFVTTCLRQQIALFLSFITIQQTNHNIYYCSFQTSLSREFLQIPLIFGSGNSCGDTIHHVSSYSFWHLLITGGYFMMNIAQKSTNGFYQIFNKYLGLHKLKQIYVGYSVIFQFVQVLIVTNSSIHSNQTAKSILATTLDGSSFNAGCFSALLFFGQYPMKNIGESQIGIFINKYLSKNVVGSLCLYSVFILQFVLHGQLINNTYYLIKYFVGRILMYCILFVTTALLLCDIKIIQIKFVKQLSSYGQHFLLFSDVVISAMYELIGDIKIGPQNTLVVMLVAVGAITVVFKGMQLFDFFLGDVRQALIFK
ncbi:Hypothetical_protein [Hexamita inflata]|uniref:Hypothetical_protein n=1 Tax=Hexamita inflata TaxID=28002 RepID=A0ABP1KTF4_9EUKA